MTNAERAGYGARAVEHGTPDFGKNGSDEDGLRTDVGDTLANLMHYCDQNAIDFDHALEDARMHFADEVAGNEW